MALRSNILKSVAIDQRHVPTNTTAVINLTPFLYFVNPGWVTVFFVYFFIAMHVMCDVFGACETSETSLLNLFLHLWLPVLCPQYLAYLCSLLIKNKRENRYNLE